MYIKTKFALAAALVVSSVSLAFAQGSNANTNNHHQRRATSHFRSAPVQLVPQSNFSRPYVSAPRGGRFSGPFRTDSAPITGGGY